MAWLSVKGIKISYQTSSLKTFYTNLNILNQGTYNSIILTQTFVLQQCIFIQTHLLLIIFQLTTANSNDNVLFSVLFQ